MREQFRGYYVPTDTEFDELWSDGWVILDTNVLLNLYRYSMDTRHSLLTMLEAVCDRLWLPHQVGLEYQRRRLEVMSRQRDVYKTLVRETDSYLERFNKVLTEHQRHPVLDSSAHREFIKNKTDEIRGYVHDLEQIHPDMPTGSAPGSVDKIRDALTELFDGRVGHGFTEDELDEICADGERRYADQIPPGFEDAKNKDGNEIYGDLVIWKEILRQARITKRPVIFVTDDRKSDWWLRHNGMTVGPRPELIEEFWIHAEKPFHMYQPDQFMVRGRERIQGSSFITDDAVSEIKELGKVKELDRERLTEQRLYTEARIRTVREELDRANYLINQFEPVMNDLSSEDMASNGTAALEAELARVEVELEHVRLLLQGVIQRDGANSRVGRSAESIAIQARLDDLSMRREDLVARLADVRYGLERDLRRRVRQAIERRRQEIRSSELQLHQLHSELAELDRLLETEHRK